MRPTARHTCDANPSFIAFLQMFVSYKIVSTVVLDGYRPGRHEVIRRFRDFTWLKNRLRSQYMGERTQGKACRLSTYTSLTPVRFYHVSRPLEPLQVSLFQRCQRRAWWRSSSCTQSSSSIAAQH